MFNEEHVFYSLEENVATVGEIKPTNGMVNFMFFCGGEEIEISRTVTTFFDILSKAGGLAGSIIVFASIVSNMVSSAAL